MSSQDDGVPNPSLSITAESSTERNKPNNPLANKNNSPVDREIQFEKILKLLNPERNAETNKYALAQIESYWNGLQNDEKQHCISSLEVVFRSQIEDVKINRIHYSNLCDKRLRRYNCIRITTVSMMVLSLVLQVGYESIERTFEIGRVITVFAPILIGGSIIFYLTQAFFRDYEVAIEAGKIAQSLIKWLRNEEARWVSEVSFYGISLQAAVAAHLIVQEVAQHDLDLTSFLSAERAASLSDLKTLGYG